MDCKLIHARFTVYGDTENGRLLTAVSTIHSRLGGEEDVDRFADARRGRRSEPEADGRQNRDGKGDEIHVAFARDLVVAEEADGERREKCQNQAGEGENAEENISREERDVESRQINERQIFGKRGLFPVSFHIHHPIGEIESEKSGGRKCRQNDGVPYGGETVSIFSQPPEEGGNEEERERRERIHEEQQDDERGQERQFPSFENDEISVGNPVILGVHRETHENKIGHHDADDFRGPSAEVEEGRQNENRHIRAGEARYNAGKETDIQKRNDSTDKIQNSISFCVSINFYSSIFV